MVIKLKVGTFNGASIIETYETVKDAEKYLNEANYYAENVELSSSFTDSVIYNSKTRLSHLMQDAKIYGEGYINVYVNF